MRKLLKNKKVVMPFALVSLALGLADCAPVFVAARHAVGG